MTNYKNFSNNNKIVSRAIPHEKWPPAASNEELAEISLQRQTDISIKGKSGPIKDLEDNFVRFLENKVKYCISFNSGTSALLAAYFAIGIKDGDEVIGSVLTFHAALSPVFILGGMPILVDIDVNTRCIDASKIEEAITSKTKAITVVHQWGHPADMDKILEIAKRHNLAVIEDCSHAHGSKYNNQFCGTFGDVAIFSLQANKMIFAGEGGLLVTNNDIINDRATLLGHYRDRSKEELADKELIRYYESGFGLKLRMSPLNAIVAKYSLSNYNKIKEERHKCLKYFIKLLEDVDFIECYHHKDNVDMGAWYGFKPMYLPEKANNISRDDFIKIMQDSGLEISVPSGKMLSDLPLYYEQRDPLFNKERKVKIGKYDNAEYVSQRALSLPTFYNFEEDKGLIEEYVKIFKLFKQEVSR